MNWNRRADNNEDESINDDFGDVKYCIHCGHEIIQGDTCEDCQERRYKHDREFDFCNH